MTFAEVIVPEVARAFIARHRDCYKTGKGGFTFSLKEDLGRIQSVLPKKVARILDIGCGMAGIDVVLKRIYPAAELWLLDGDGVDPRDGWLDERGAFSSRDAANALLAANGVKADRWINVNTKEALEADLVISLASWGYHYPLSTYNVTRGLCIADLRKAKEPARGKVLVEYPKRNLCAWHAGKKP